MKLSNATNDALCPVCALAGLKNQLVMQSDSLAIGCVQGHTFDTLELSILAGKYELKADNR